MGKLTFTKKYNPYPKYKDSGVEWLGKIPSDWGLVPIKSLYRRTKRTKHPDETLLSVYRDWGVINKSSRDDNFNKPSEDLSLYQLVQPGDLVTNKMKTWQGSIAVSAIRGIVSPAYYVMKPLLKQDGKYYHYLLRSDRYIAHYENISSGIRVNQWDLDYLQFKNSAILLPSEEEQARIAKHLDEKTTLIESVIEKKKKQIELLIDKRSSLIYHAVTQGLNPKVKLVDCSLPWIGPMPENWELLPNKILLKKRKKLVGNRHADFPLLSLTRQGVIVRDIEGGKGKFSEDMSTFQVVKPGNLIFCLFDIQETPRTVGFSNSHGMITGAYTVFECSDSVLARFIEYFYIAMDDKKSLSYLYSGLRNTIAPPRFLRIPTPIPPTQERQEIVDYLDRQRASITETIEKVEKSIELLQEFKSSLISHAVTGKILI